MSDPEVQSEGLVEQDLTNPSASSGFFGQLRCRRLDFRYRVAAEKFDIPKFLSFFGPAKAATCRTLDPDGLDYHLHFTWEVKKDSIILFLGFFSGTITARDGEREPYAENFMPWLGGFFENHTAHGDVHVEFRYPAVQRKSRLLLPLTIAIFDDEKAEVTGMSLRFPPRSMGVAGARIEQGDKRLTIELNGSTNTDFTNFDLREEVENLSSFSLRLTEDKKAV